jgi:hypothetical protein
MYSDGLRRPLLELLPGVLRTSAPAETLGEAPEVRASDT